MPIASKVVIAEQMLNQVKISLVEADIDIGYWESVGIAGNPVEQAAASKNLITAKTNKEMAERRIRSIESLLILYKKEEEPGSTLVS